MSNIGVLTSRRTKESDEIYTPYYAVEPLLQYIKPNSTIWCPFDLEWSAYVQTFKEQGYNVIHSHLDLDVPVEGSPFASAYFCKDLLPKDLIGLELIKYKKEL